MERQATRLLGVVRQSRIGILMRLSMGLVRLARRKPLGIFGLFIIVSFTLLALAAPLIAPYDPYKLGYEHRMEGPSINHWLGTDVLGRDVLSRTIYGARVSLYVALVCMLLAGNIGLMLGVSSAYIGGRFDLLVQRLIDATSSIPSLILALALVAALGASVTNVIVAITIVETPRITRVLRSVALSIKEIPYIDAARTMGASPLRIMVRHVAPNTFAPLLIVASGAAGAIILTESSLSFLGVGIPARSISWGIMLSGPTRVYIMAAPWMALGPGLALTLAVFGINMFGDALRDVLDPKLRGR